MEMRTFVLTFSEYDLILRSKREERQKEERNRGEKRKPWRGGPTIVVNRASVVRERAIANICEKRMERRE